MKEKTELYGIYDGDFSLRFTGMSILKATVMKEAKMMEHPLEDGSSIADHRILLPVEIEIAALLPSGLHASLYAELKQAFSGTELFHVHTRAGIYSSMAMAAMPHEETLEQADILPVVLRFKETILAETQYQALPPRKVKHAGDTSTVKRAEQTPGKGKTGLASVVDGGRDIITKTGHKISSWTGG